jgi:hypothetical protein
MVEFRCPVPGCGQVFASERALAGHLGGKHRGYKAAGVVMEEGDSMDEAEEMVVNSEGWTVPSEEPVVDQRNLLRRLLQLNNITGNKREAIVKMFEYYDEDDAEGLDTVLRKNNINKATRELVVELYKKEMDIVDRDDDEEQTPIKGRRNPLNANPTDYADDPMGLMQWAKDMMKTKVIMDQMGSMMGAMGFIKGTTVGTELPPDIQKELNELREWREEQRRQKEMEPLIRRINQLQQALEEKEEEESRSDSMSDIMEMVKMKALLKSLGDDEGAMKLQVMMDQKAEQERLRREEEAKQFQARLEMERQNAQNMQMQLVQAQMKAQNDLMNMQLQFAQQAKSRDVLDVMKEAQEISEAISAFKGQSAAQDLEAQKAANIASILSSVAQTLGPVASEIAKSYGEGKRNAQAASRPEGGRTAPVEDDYSVMDCSECGAKFSYPSNVPGVTCPRCHTRFELQGTAEDDRRSALMQLPVSDLAQTASSFGIDPTLPQYQDKGRLVDDLIRVAESKGLGV